MLELEVVAAVEVAAEPEEDKVQDQAVLEGLEAQEVQEVIMVMMAMILKTVTAFPGLDSLTSSTRSLTLREWHHLNALLRLNFSISSPSR